LINKLKIFNFSKKDSSKLSNQAHHQVSMIQRKKYLLKNDQHQEKDKERQ
jgi:hypothetical protein